MVTLKAVLYVLVHLSVQLQIVEGFWSRETYNLTLSNSGPVLPGSALTFKAQLQLKTGCQPHDWKFFTYNWVNSLNHELKKTRANFNSCLDLYYPFYLNPGQYEMNVTVYDILERKIARKSQSFFLAEHLNGILTANQTLKHRNPDSPNTFSTDKPVKLKVNLTDSFQGSLSKTFIWYNLSKDGKPVASNKPILEQMYYRGDYKVKVKVTSYRDVVDCRGKEHENSLTGTFEESFTMKDPVTSAEIHGRMNHIPLSHLETYHVSFNGSGPFIICWTLVDKNEMNVNDTTLKNCTGEINTTDGYNIIIESPDIEGAYVLNITVQNDVSLFANHRNLTVGNSSPRTSSSMVVVVTCSLLVSCVLIAVAVYIAKLPKKNHRSEVADFDFHPSLLSDINSRSRNESFVASIKPKLSHIGLTFWRLFNRDNYTKTHRQARYMRVMSDTTYGSISESVSLTL